MGGPAIVVEGLRKSYGKNEAVRGIDFEVPAGEVFALLGPNGAGKTTTVEILEGFRHRDQGTVSVLGIDPQRGGRRLRERVGIVLQECGFDPYLTVIEAARMHAARYPAPRSPDDVVALVGLDEQRDQRVKTLSGGQQRRLDLALGLVGDPELLFLDEPTTGFDPSARRASWEIVRELCSLGKTVLLTTHYMDEAQALAATVAVITRGAIVATGSPDDIAGRDRLATVVSFVAPEDIALSDLPVPVVAEGERVRFEITDGDDTARVLHTLTGWALERQVDLVGLTVARPTLEDVYLLLTGEHATGEHATGDEAAPEGAGR